MIIFSMLTAHKSHRYKLSNVDNIPSGNTAAEDQHIKRLLPVTIKFANHT